MDLAYVSGRDGSETACGNIMTRRLMVHLQRGCSVLFKRSTHDPGRRLTWSHTPLQRMVQGRRRGGVRGCQEIESVEYYWPKKKPKAPVDPLHTIWRCARGQKESSAYHLGQS